MAPCPSSVKPSQGCGTQHSPQDRAYMPSDRVVGQCGQEPKNYSSTSKSGLFKPNMSVYKPLSSQKGKKKNHDVGKRGRSCPPVRAILYYIPAWGPILNFPSKYRKTAPLRSWHSEGHPAHPEQSTAIVLQSREENSNSLIQEGWDPRERPPKNLVRCQSRLSWGSSWPTARSFQQQKRSSESEIGCAVASWDGNLEKFPLVFPWRTSCWEEKWFRVVYEKTFLVGGKRILCYNKLPFVSKIQQCLPTSRRTVLMQLIDFGKILSSEYSQAFRGWVI